MKLLLTVFCVADYNCFVVVVVVVYYVWFQAL